MPYNDLTSLWATGEAANTCQGHVLLMTSRSCLQNQLLPNGLRMHQNLNCSRWCIKLKYHLILCT